MSERDERSGRETRLLALVIVVALAALLVLARFRFPAAELADVRPTQGPLDRLVARSTYEDLAASVATLVQRVSSAVVVLQIESLPPPESEPPAKGRPGIPPPTPRLVPGARLAGDLAVVHVPRGFAVSAGQGLSAPVEVVRTDEARELAVVRAPSVLEIASITANPVEAFSGFSFVGVVEAAIGGVTARPAFAGRADLATDARWPRPIMVLGGSADLPVGALVFALDGRFIGMVASFDRHSRALVPAAALTAIADALQQAAPASPTGTPVARGGRRRGGSQ